MGQGPDLSLLQNLAIIENIEGSSTSQVYYLKVPSTGRLIQQENLRGSPKSREQSVLFLIQLRELGQQLFTSCERDLTCHGSSRKRTAESVERKGGTCEAGLKGIFYI